MFAEVAMRSAGHPKAVRYESYAPARVGSVPYS